MRKFEQKQLLDIMKTFEDAHSEIAGMLAKKDLHSAAALMADCQQSALKVGEIIERLEGMETKTVALLEEYCDLLYNSTVEMNENASSTKISKTLQKQLNKISNSINLELKPNRLEILFLPYKAAMWDSMESVWLAAKKDPSCDTYVMPIPYFDMLPNRKTGKMHYEATEFPDYVPITDWQKYDIEKRHPDIIVIHNPYDDGNLVTSVHPDYYSSKLREYTDLLVYIPYFVSFDNNICFGSGLLYSDRVIVQSESVRETYLKEYRKFEDKNCCKGAFGKAENKFEALGSPKFDKVINTKTEDLDIPDTWLKLINNQDGTRKKVVLFNTTIASLLYGNEKILKKLRNVFDSFENMDNVVLLWRPHPLNSATYEAMRPELIDEYRRIVAQYRQSGWGIYDDSADLNRAIAVSDAYYGDWSSLVALYICTGKPIMIQAVDNSPVPEAVNKVIGNFCAIENKHMSLKEYIDTNRGSTEFYTFAERKNELCSELAVNLDGTAGQKIYEYLKRTTNFGGETK